MNKTTTQKYLDKVINSAEFKNSKTNQRLLVYLYKYIDSDEIPREIDIAIDIFNKDKTYNPNIDSLVRSHMYALRKKLEKYYLTHGVNDEIRFVIPKGRYELQTTVHKTQHASPYRSKISRVVFAMFALLLLAIAIHFYQDYVKNVSTQEIIQVSADNQIWSDFIDSQNPTLLALGDYFIFWEKRKYTQGDRKIRDGAINSVEDLEKFKKEYPEYAKSIQDNIGSYITPSLLEAVPVLYPYFTYHSKALTIIPASYLSQEIIDTHNIIFIGPYKTLYTLNEKLKKLSLDFNFYPHQITIDQDENLDYLNLRLPDQSMFRKDYLLFSKTPGPNNTIHLIFAFFSPSYVGSKLSKIVSDELIQEIQQEYLDSDDSFPSFFESVLVMESVEEKINLNVGHFLAIDKENF